MKKDRLRTQQPAPRNPEHFGAFMPDGSYFREATLAQRGPLDRFVRAMVKSRGTFGFDPKTAAEGIVLTKHESAFPNHAQWATVHEQVHPGAAVWPFVRTTTSAEEAVKRCGMGVRGPHDEPRHWCGEMWVTGDEKRCDNPAHREKSSPEQVREMLSRIMHSLPAGLAP